MRQDNISLQRNDVQHFNLTSYIHQEQEQSFRVYELVNTDVLEAIYEFHLTSK